MAPEPGWYPDPNDGNLDRYWDGSGWGTGEGAIRGVSPAAAASTAVDGAAPGTRVPARPAASPPSAPLVAAGLVGLVVGLMIQTAGNAAAARAALNAGYFGEVSSEGLGIAVFGGVVMLVSLVVLAIGFYRMAAGIDHLVRHGDGRSQPHL